jgi:hypothetical protein
MQLQDWCSDSAQQLGTRFLTTWTPSPVPRLLAYLVADTAAVLPETELMPWDEHNVAQQQQKKCAWPRNVAASGQAEEDMEEDKQEHKQEHEQDQQDDINMATKPKAPAFAIVSGGRAPAPAVSSSNKATKKSKSKLDAEAEAEAVKDAGGGEDSKDKTKRASTKPLAKEESAKKPCVKALDQEEPDMLVDEAATMFWEVDNSLAQWQEKLINSKEVVVTTMIKTPAVLAEVTTVMAETLAAVCNTLHSLEQGRETDNEKLTQCSRTCTTALLYLEVQHFLQATNMVVSKTFDKRWKEMRTMHTHLCKKTQLYKWMELGHLVHRCPNLQYQAVLTTHNAFRKTVKWLGKVQPLMKAFVEMIPTDSRLNWGPYDLHTDGFTVMQMPASLIAAMDKLPMCKLMEQTRNHGSPVAIKSKKMDKNCLQVLVGPQEKSPL